MEEIQKSLQLYREQIKFYSDFVINLTKDYNKIFDKVMELQKDVRELKGEKLPVKATMIPLKGGKYGKYYKTTRKRSKVPIRLRLPSLRER